MESPSSPAMFSQPSFLPNMDPSSPPPSSCIRPTDTKLESVDGSEAGCTDAQSQDHSSSSDSAPKKKRKSWGQILPEPTTNLPPRKRAKTEAEKEQRRYERVQRNRAAAHASRMRKQEEADQLRAENNRLKQDNAGLVEELSRLREQLSTKTFDSTVRPPTPPYEYNATPSLAPQSPDSSSPSSNSISTPPPDQDDGYPYSVKELDSSHSAVEVGLEGFQNIWGNNSQEENDSKSMMEMMTMMPPMINMPTHEELYDRNPAPEADFGMADFINMDDLADNSAMTQYESKADNADDTFANFLNLDQAEPVVV